MIKYQYGFDHLDKLIPEQENGSECERNFKAHEASSKYQPLLLEIPPKTNVSLNTSSRYDSFKKAKINCFSFQESGKKNEYRSAF